MMFAVISSYRFIVLRTKIGLKNFVVEKMALLLDRSLTQRNVRAFLRQRNEDLYDVAISCETSEKTDRALKYLTEEGFAEGGPPSKDLILKEGQPLFIKFRGNVQCVDEKPKLNLIFNTHIKCRTDLKVMELDTFAQKGLPCYRGFAQVFTRALVPKPVQEGTTRKPNEPPEMVEAEILLAELLIEIPKVTGKLSPFLSEICKVQNVEKQFYQNKYTCVKWILNKQYSFGSYRYYGYRF